MAYSHRQDDSRICGATTIVVGQNFVSVEGKLWAVENDPNTDGGGELIHSQSFVTIDGKLVILTGDSAAADNLCPIPPHCVPSAVGYSDLVDVL